MKSEEKIVKLAAQIMLTAASRLEQQAKQEQELANKLYERRANGDQYQIASVTAAVIRRLDAVFETIYGELNSAIKESEGISEATNFIEPETLGKIKENVRMLGELSSTHVSTDDPGAQKHLEQLDEVIATLYMLLNI